MSSWDNTELLEKSFKKQVDKGYPRNYKKPSNNVMVGGEAVSVDDVPF